jgi:uncharacterized protein
MTPSALDRVIYQGGRIRPVWRIALYFSCFFLLTGVAQYFVSVLPRHPLQWASLVAVTTAALLSGWIMLSKLDRRPFGALGFAIHRGALRESLLGLALGGALIAGAILSLFITRSARFATDAGSASEYLGFLGWTLLFFAIAAAFEEVIFRGYPFQVLVEWIGAWPAIVITALLFAFLHGQNPNVSFLALANIFLAGVLLSIAYLRTRSLWFATGVHLGWNWTMASLFDFPVSGLNFDTPLYTGEPVGSDWWTGGAFGPEAGIVGTVVLLVGMIALSKASWISPAAAVTALRPIVDERLPPGRLG